MSKWIDAEWLTDAVEGTDWYHINKDGELVSGARSDEDALYKAVDVYKVIDEAPSIDIVRCKECKYWQDSNGGYPTTECRWVDCETPDADDFCSYGERASYRQVNRAERRRVMTDFELSLLYDRLDRLVESGDMTEEEAREEWRELITESRGEE